MEQAHHAEGVAVQKREEHLGPAKLLVGHRQTFVAGTSFHERNCLSVSQSVSQSVRQKDTRRQGEQQNVNNAHNANRMNEVNRLLLLGCVHSSVPYSELVRAEEPSHWALLPTRTVPHWRRSARSDLWWEWSSTGMK
jgi:hypothetical protein